MQETKATLSRAKLYNIKYLNENVISLSLAYYNRIKKETKEGMKPKDGVVLVNFNYKKDVFNFIGYKRLDSDYSYNGFIIGLDKYNLDIMKRIDK